MSKHSHSMSCSMTDTDLLKCRNFFWNVDDNRDGKLSWREFSDMCNSVGLSLTPKQVNKAFRIADRNRDGSITFAEFASAYFSGEKRARGCLVKESVHEISPGKLTAVREHFYDKDHNGKLTRPEFIQMTTDLAIIMNDEEYKRVFELADKSKEGEVSFEEFVCLFMKSSKENVTKLLNAISIHFRDAECNESGEINKSEFENVMKAVGVTLNKRQIDHVFRRADKDGSGGVSFDEFKDVYLHSSFASNLNKNEKPDLSTLPSDKVHMIRKYFMERDVDRNGRLSRKEFLSMLQDLGINLKKQTLTKAFNIIDEDRNGSISFREFIHIFSSVEELDEFFKRKQRMSEKEIAQCCKYFWASDRDRDGMLSKAEFTTMVGSIGMNLSKEEIDRAFDIADRDHNELISFSEFAKTYLNKSSRTLSSQQIKEVFSKFDHHDKGYLSRQECLQALQALGNTMDRESLEKMIDTIDGDNDRQISLVEFVLFLDIEE